MRLFSVLTDLAFETEPKSGWPQVLRDVVSVGEETIVYLEMELDRLASRLPTGIGPQQQLGSDLLSRLQNVWKELEMAKLLYFSVALCYIKSPRVAAPLCSLLEKNIQSWVWPRLIDDNIVMFDPFERVYIASARAFYWVCAANVLPRLRQILREVSRRHDSMLNALPYALRAIGFLGTSKDIPLVETFQDFSCPPFDVSEATVRIEAKHALYALRHPEERQNRASSHIDTWRRDDRT